MSYVATVLGRRVPATDWVSRCRDEVLVVLYKQREQPLAVQTLLTMADVDRFTGLESTDLPELRRVLREFVAVDRADDAPTITDRGVRWVEESPRQP